MVDLLEPCASACDSSSNLQLCREPPGGLVARENWFMGVLGFYIQSAAQDRALAIYVQTAH